VALEPDDLPLRLVFADWLDERGDPLGEFVRVQCDLEPVRHDYDDPRAHELRNREKELLREHGKEWLGEAAFLHKLVWPYSEAFTFWRGLPDEVALPVHSVEEHGSLLRSCPTLQKVVVFEVHGQGKRLAGCAALQQFPALEVADWITPADARALAASPHLRELQTLAVWLGNRDQKRVCRAFAVGLPELRLLELVQHWAGWANERPRRSRTLNARADEVAALVNQIRGTTIARVRRPFERLFPLRENVHHGIYAGPLPDGRQALAQCGGEDLMVVFFDADGTLLGEELRSLEGVLTREPTNSWLGYNEAEMLEYLLAEFGFRPGLIHVKEFCVDQDDRGFLSVDLHDGNYAQFIESPDTLPQYANEEERREIGAKIHRWLRQGDFVVCGGGDAWWAGPDGYVHST
jgi:uncharacterized protein (TIGR02996 family)